MDSLKNFLLVLEKKPLLLLHYKLHYCFITSYTHFAVEVYSFVTAYARSGSLVKTADNMF